MPALAAELGRRPTDGLTWTYHLRPGLKWSDGQPLTANDVAYTFNRVHQRQVRADELRQLRRGDHLGRGAPTTRRSS